MLPKTLSPLVLLFIGATAAATETAEITPGEFRLLSFGISERAMFQPNYQGANLTTMLSWQPELDLSNKWSAVGTIGFFGLAGTDKHFPAFRTLVGAAYQGLSARWVPEFSLGAEAWVRSLGGVYFTTALNLHYRVRPTPESGPDWLKGIARSLDSVWLGHQALFVPDKFGNQIVLGLRLSFPPRKLTAEPAIPPAASQPVPISEIVRPKFTGPVEAIHFPTGSHDLDPSSYPTLNELAKQLQENPAAKIELQGHTDDVGEESANHALSEKRAEAVRRYLIEHGLAENRVRSRGYGSERPKMPGKSPEARSANRRVETMVIEQGDKK